MAKGRKKEPASEVERKLEKITQLLQYSIALDLNKAGVSQQQIAKSLGIATASVNAMLKGIKRD